MKRHKASASGGGVSKRSRNQRARPSSNINDLLKECLQRVCDLQQDLARQDDFERDPQAAGYAACAIETLKFLTKEGLPSDHPMMKVLHEKFMGDNK